ncbi:MAG TPA: hypothetical protein ENK42_00150 [Deltaproteobacteria bacterium]|nr:hypothetical protein [Deltaproteobacteria bacterium]
MKWRAILIAVVMVSVTTLYSISATAGNVIVRKATGEVVATDTVATPNTIVVRTTNWKGQEFIVGAAVEDDTVIKIGDRPATLEEVKEGDKVDIVYERNKRVIAKTIRIKR